MLTNSEYYSVDHLIPFIGGIVVIDDGDSNVQVAHW